MTYINFDGYLPKPSPVSSKLKESGEVLTTAPANIEGGFSTRSLQEEGGGGATTFSLNEEGGTVTRNRFETGEEPTPGPSIPFREGGYGGPTQTTFALREEGGGGTYIR